MDWSGTERRGPDLLAVFECRKGHKTTVPSASWSLNLAKQETPMCPTCKYDGGCKAIGEEELPVYNWRTERVAKRRLFWHSCPQCKTVFPMVWQFKGELVRQWLQQHDLPLRLARAAEGNGWDLLSYEYEKPGKRRPRFREAGQNRAHSTFGYWLAEDLVQLAAYHIQSFHRMHHSVKDGAVATRGRPPDMLMADLGRDGPEGYQIIRRLLNQAHVLLERVHGRRMINVNNAFYAEYEMESGPEENHGKPT
jgi:hypothetical protein